MLRKGVILTIGLLLIAGIASATVYEFFTVEQISMRLRGINADLESLVEDEFTDWTHLPYNLLDVEGYRLYTNLSNYSRVNQDTPGNEQALTGASTVDQWMIGGVVPILEDHRVGLLYGIDSAETADDIEEDPAGTPSGETGEFDEITVVTIPGVAQKLSESGDASTETSVTTLLLNYAIPLSEVMDIRGVPNIGIAILSDNSEILETNNYSMTDDDDTTGATDDVQKDSFSQETKGQINLGLDELNFDASNSVFMIAAEWDVIDDLKVGVALASKSATREYSDTYTYKRHQSALFGGTAEDNTRKDTLDLSIDADGSAFGPCVLMAEYGISDVVTLRGGIDINSLDISGSGDYTLKDERIIGPLPGVADDGIIAKTSASTDVDATESTIDVYVGTENKLSEKLTLGVGIRRLTDKFEMKMDWSGKETDEAGTVTSYGANPMAELGFPGVAGHDVAMEMITETEEITFPIGLEYQATKALAIRLGASHHITTTKDELNTKVAMYNDALLPVKSKITTVESDESTETKARTTDFSYGAGLKVGENLDIDIISLVEGNDLLDLNNWRISATLKF